MSYFRWIIAVLVVVGGLSCQSTERKQQTVMERTRSQELGKIREIQYRRGGGTSSNKELLTIMPDGQASSESSLFGAGKKTLSEFQLLQLSQWFENSGKWATEYPGKRTDAVTEIQYGDLNFRVSESATDVPEDLTKLQGILRELVKEVAGK